MVETQIAPATDSVKHHRRALLKTVALALIAALTLSLVGCNAGVAATVNGDKIYEAEVTEYIQAYRSLDDTLATDEGLASWLVSSGITAEELRKGIIDYFTQVKIIEQAAEENGVSVTSEEVNEEIASEKASYSDQSTWSTLLAQYGYTEDTYKDATRLRLLSEKLQTILAADVAPTDEECQEYLNSYGSYLVGKRSSRILCADAESAETALAALNGGMSFSDAAAAYSTDVDTASSGGDMGWDASKSLDSVYSSTLDGLAVGAMSAVVQTGDGYEIILCTDEWKAADDGTYPLASCPQEIRDLVEEALMSSLASEKYSALMTERYDSAEIVINDMPSRLPYDVDLSAYTTGGTSSQDSAYSTDAGAAAGGTATSAGSASGDASGSEGSVDGVTAATTE